MIAVDKIRSLYYSDLQCLLKGKSSFSFDQPMLQTQQKEIGKLFPILSVQRSGSFPSTNLCCDHLRQ